MQHQNQFSEMSSFLEDESRTSSDMILQPAKIAVKQAIARQATRRPSHDSHAASSLTGSVGSHDEKASTSGQPPTTAAGAPSAASSTSPPPVTQKAEPKKDKSKRGFLGLFTRAFSKPVSTTVIEPPLEAITAPSKGRDMVRGSQIDFQVDDGDDLEESNDGQSDYDDYDDYEAGGGEVSDDDDDESLSLPDAMGDHPNVRQPDDSATNAAEPDSSTAALLSAVKPLEAVVQPAFWSSLFGLSHPAAGHEAVNEAKQSSLTDHDPTSLHSPSTDEMEAKHDALSDEDEAKASHTHNDGDDDSDSDADASNEAKRQLSPPSSSPPEAAAAATRKGAKDTIRGTFAAWLTGGQKKRADRTAAGSTATATDASPTVTDAPPPANPTQELTSSASPSLGKTRRPMTINLNDLDVHQQPPHRRDSGASVHSAAGSSQAPSTSASVAHQRDAVNTAMGVDRTREVDDSDSERLPPVPSSSSAARRIKSTADSDDDYGSDEDDDEAAADADDAGHSRHSASIVSQLRVDTVTEPMSSGVPPAAHDATANPTANATNAAIWGLFGLVVPPATTTTAAMATAAVPDDRSVSSVVSSGHSSTVSSAMQSSVVSSNAFSTTGYLPGQRPRTATTTANPSRTVATSSASPETSKKKRVMFAAPGGGGGVDSDDDDADAIAAGGGSGGGSGSTRARSGTSATKASTSAASRESSSQQATRQRILTEAERQRAHKIFHFVCLQRHMEHMDPTVLRTRQQQIQERHMARLKRYQQRQKRRNKAHSMHKTATNTTQWFDSDGDGGDGGGGYDSLEEELANVSLTLNFERFQQALILLGYVERGELVKQVFTGVYPPSSSSASSSSGAVGAGGVSGGGRFQFRHRKSRNNAGREEINEDEFIAALVELKEQIGGTTTSSSSSSFHRSQRDDDHGDVGGDDDDGDDDDDDDDDDDGDDDDEGDEDEDDDLGIDDDEEEKDNGDDPDAAQRRRRRQRQRRRRQRRRATGGSGSGADGNDIDLFARIEEQFEALYAGTCEEDNQRDDAGSKYILAHDFRRIMTQRGVKMTDEEIEEMMREIKPRPPNGRIFLDQYQSLLLSQCT